MKLQFTQQAIDDLARLREFIAAMNPAAATRISQQLTKSIQALVENPVIGHDIELPGVQEWVASNYVVHYTVSDGVLTVLQVWHGREDR